MRNENEKWDWDVRMRNEVNKWVWQMRMRKEVDKCGWQMRMRIKLCINKKNTFLISCQINI